MYIDRHIYIYVGIYMCIHIYVTDALIQLCSMSTYAERASERASEREEREGERSREGGREGGGKID